MYTPVHLLYFHEILINLLPFFDTYFQTAIRSSAVNDEYDDMSLFNIQISTEYLYYNWTQQCCRHKNDRWTRQF